MLNMNASGSKKRKGKSVIQFDKAKFVSENAQNRYYDSISNRNSIVERGLCATEINWPSITANIRKRKWDDFCAQPLAAIIPVVREFMSMRLNIITKRFL